MASYIRRFLAVSRPKGTEYARTLKGINDFCYKNTVVFKKNFLKKFGLKKSRDHFMFAKHDEMHNFVTRLATLKGECVFLLKDTYDVLKMYQKKTNKGYGILANRNALCRNEEDYFRLIELFYGSLEGANNIKDFLTNYRRGFAHLTATDQHFEKRARGLAEYVSNHTVKGRVCFVDMGFQFTFSLFCWASVRSYAREIVPDFFSYSTYPWLQKFFKGKFHTSRSEDVLNLELRAMRNFQKSLRERASGSLLGFAIGDALGFPAAGINASDVPKFFPTGITSFQQNPRHPFFTRLKKGNHTDNTNLLMITAAHLAHHKGLAANAYAHDLAVWGRCVLKNPADERWLGPTAKTAIENLIKGKNYLSSGSRTTQSCSATFRTIPLGVFYRPFRKGDPTELVTVAETAALITHNTEISKTGAAIAALIVSDLMHGVPPARAVDAALAIFKPTKGNELLLRRIKNAVSFYALKDVAFARSFFGTGSPIHQTLPLAIFCFLKYQHNFENAVLAAANSYRNDSPSEQRRLAKFDWREQLLNARGGNTDGIAALTGAFAGAHLGIDKIPKKFHQVENKNKLVRLGIKLV